MRAAPIRPGPHDRPIAFDTGASSVERWTIVRTHAELVDALAEEGDLLLLSGRRRESEGSAAAVISSIPTHFRVPLFNDVSERLAAVGAAFRAIFLSHGRADRSAWMELGEASFDHDFARSLSPSCPSSAGGYQSTSRGVWLPLSRR